MVNTRSVGTALVLGAASTLSSPAIADEVPLPSPPPYLVISPPADWQEDLRLATKISTTVQQTRYLGDESGVAGAVVFQAAGEGALYVSWVDGVKRSITPDTVLRAAFDKIHHAPFLASNELGALHENSYRESLRGSIAEMNFSWTHDLNETENDTRALGWVGADGLVHLLIAECITPAGSTAAREACQNSASAIAIKLPEDSLSPLSSLPSPSPLPEAEPMEKLPPLKTGNSDPPSLAPAGEPGKVLYTGDKAPESKKSNRTMIIIGAILLALAFYLTTRSPKEDKEDNQG